MLETQINKVHPLGYCTCLWICSQTSFYSWCHYCYWWALAISPREIFCQLSLYLDIALNHIRLICSCQDILVCSYLYLDIEHWVLAIIVSYNAQCDEQHKLDCEHFRCHNNNYFLIIKQIIASLIKNFRFQFLPSNWLATN